MTVELTVPFLLSLAYIYKRLLVFIKQGLDRKNMVTMGGWV